MGHLGYLKDEYRALVRRLEAGTISMPEPRDPRAWEGWKEILEILCTPEEAALAARLPTTPTDLRKLAGHLGMTPETLEPRLDALCDRGLIMDLINPRTGHKKYMLSPPVVGFFEFSLMRAKDSIPKKRMAEALHAYTQGDDSFAREAFGGETVIGRALVHETAFSEDALPDVLDWERATQIVSEARSFAVALCYCRHKAEHLGQACDAPMDTCLSLDAGADFVARRNFGRSIERAEAMDILVKARESGLVQIADNVRQRPTFICNCCGCCCGQLQAINEFNLPAVNPSGFVAHSDLTKCNGCSRCSRACPITAITMKAARVEAKRKNTLAPVVDEDRCIGCGVCSDQCKKDAMQMQRRAKQPHVPLNVIEKSLRMAMERGHLARMMFDEGSGRGVKFLGQVVQAILSLPPAQRALASEQVKSRFVRAALNKIKDPTG